MDKKEEIIVQMVSDTANEHCDKYPNLSFHRGNFTENNIFAVADRIDFIPPHFKIKVVDKLPEVKECVSCRNIFPNEPENFIEVEGEESCIRCFERVYIPARARDIYHDKMKVQFAKKYESKLKTAAEDFIKKVDEGKARSTDSYNKFKEALK